MDQPSAASISQQGEAVAGKARQLAKCVGKAGPGLAANFNLAAR